MNDEFWKLKMKNTKMFFEFEMKKNLILMTIHLGCAYRQSYGVYYSGVQINESSSNNFLVVRS